MPETGDTQLQAGDPAAAALQARLDQAMGLHRQGKIAEAERIYRDILRDQPNNSAALHLLGVIALQTRHSERAVELIGQAIALDPGHPEAHLNRGLAFRSLNRAGDALASFAKAIELNPDYAEAHFNRGLVLGELKRPAEALASYSRAIELKPDYAEAYCNRGLALQNLKRPEDALANYDKAIALKRDFSRAHFNRGNVLQDLKRLKDALASFDNAIELRPDDADSHCNRGDTLLRLRRSEDALKSFDTAIALRPELALAHNNRGIALNELNRREEALASYDKAIALNSGFVLAHINRGDTLLRLKRPEEAVHSLQRAIALKPDHDFLHGELARARMALCDWKTFDADVNHQIQAIGRGEKVSEPFPLLATIDSPELQKKAAGIYGLAKFPPNDALPKIARRQRKKKIRLGYFSADFRDHPGAYSMVEMFELNDRSAFETVGFSFSPSDTYELKSRLQAAFDKFVDVRFRDDLEVAQLAREMEIDIAIDRNGFTTYCRPNIFASRAAPLQVSYKAYPGTMALDYIDYLIADSVVIPPEHRCHYSEKIVYLPNSYQVYDSKREISGRSFTRDELGLPPKGFVFCCFNNNNKITPAIFDCWMRLLEEVDDSVLWLLENNATATANLRREARARNIDPGRLVFADWMNLSDHLARHRLADLFIDTLPYNAHTTASDALWAGLPVLTCLGETFAGRVAASLLHAIGLPELVATTLQAYEQMAVELATQPRKLAAIKSKLADNRLTTPLFDTRLYTRHIEAACIAMFERYQAGLPPDHIVIPKS